MQDCLPQGYQVGAAAMQHPGTAQTCIVVAFEANGRPDAGAVPCERTSLRGPPHASVGGTMSFEWRRPEADLERSIRACIQARSSTLAQPAALVQLPALPRLASGKIDRRGLASVPAWCHVLSTGQSGGSGRDTVGSSNLPDVPATSECLVMLAAAQALAGSGVETFLEPNTNVLEAGANSMQIAALAALVGCDPGMVYQFPTPRSLTKAVQRARHSDSHGQGHNLTREQADSRALAPALEAFPVHPDSSAGAGNVGRLVRSAACLNASQTPLELPLHRREHQGKPMISHRLGALQSNTSNRSGQEVVQAQVQALAEASVEEISGACKDALTARKTASPHASAEIEHAQRMPDQQTWAAEPPVLSSRRARGHTVPVLVTDSRGERAHLHADPQHLPLWEPSGQGECSNSPQASTAVAEMKACVDAPLTLLQPGQLPGSGAVGELPGCGAAGGARGAGRGGEMLSVPDRYALPTACPKKTCVLSTVQWLLVCSHAGDVGCFLLHFSSPRELSPQSICANLGSKLSAWRLWTSMVSSSPDAGLQVTESCQFVVVACLRGHLQLLRLQTGEPTATVDTCGQLRRSLPSPRVGANALHGFLQIVPKLVWARSPALAEEPILSSSLLC
jgi:hypothetical protein